MEHLGPKVVLGERGECLVTTKVSHESASMSLLQKEQTKRRFGKAKLVSSHKIIILDVISFLRCMRQTLGIRSSKGRIIRIQVFYVFKANNIQLKFSDKHAYA